MPVCNIIAIGCLEKGWILFQQFSSAQEHLQSDHARCVQDGCFVASKPAVSGVELMRILSGSGKTIFFERQVHEANCFLKRMHPGFHNRLKESVKRNADTNTLFTLELLQQLLENENEESDEGVRTAFTFLSVVYVLRQSLPTLLQDW